METVGVRRRDGSTRYIRFRGYVDYDDFQRLRASGEATAILMDIWEYQENGDIVMPRIRVPAGSWVAGCLINRSAYGISDNGRPILIERPT